MLTRNSLNVKLQRTVRENSLHFMEILNAMGVKTSIDLAKTKHIADRILDRYDSPKQGLAICTEIISNFLKYKFSEFMYIFNKNKHLDNFGFVIAIRKDNKYHHIGCTCYNNMSENTPSIGIVMRTVFINNKLYNDNIDVSYTRPKIWFINNNYRTELHPIEKMITSKNCPKALEHLKFGLTQ